MLVQLLVPQLLKITKDLIRNENVSFLLLKELLFYKKNNTTRTEAPGEDILIY